MKTLRALPWLCAIVFAGGLSAHAQDSQPKAVDIPNDESYWRRAGFVEMVPPVRLPTDTRNDNLIKVWLRIPDGGKITLEWLADQQRNTLKFPPGTVADRVETMRNQRKALQTIDGIFTVERATDDVADYHLEPTGRYSHAENYVRRVLAAAALGSIGVEHVVLRKERGKDVQGLLVSGRLDGSQ
jgi:hypothetical protein